MGCLNNSTLAMQAEESALKSGRTQVADGKAEYPVWNHWEFAVVYKSLAQQLCIGGIYVKLLMDGLDKVRFISAYCPNIVDCFFLFLSARPFRLEAWTGFTSRLFQMSERSSPSKANLRLVLVFGSCRPKRQGVADWQDIYMQ